MRLPDELRTAVHIETGTIPHGELTRAVAELTSSYKQGSISTPVIDTAAKLGAYLQVRLPATFAANSRVLHEIAMIKPDWQPRSVVDLGAGPGTATWAAAEAFPSIESCTLLERDQRTLAAGRRLARSSRNRAVQEAVWFQADFSDNVGPDAELVLISYALGELSPRRQKVAIQSAWEHTKDLLVIVGPGTPRDFETILAARSQLIAAGAHILAPCPHDSACPMAGGEDWCHFAQRLERSSDHRRLKAGALGYEDEKFSYVVASRAMPDRTEARILRHPLKHSGHLQLRLCTPEGLSQITITRSQKESYRRARKAEWGDTWSTDASQK